MGMIGDYLKKRAARRLREALQKRHSRMVRKVAPQVNEAHTAIMGTPVTLGQSEKLVDADLEGIVEQIR